MKFTLFVTERCNLACDYCYVGKRGTRMPLSLASRIIDFAFRRAPPDEHIEIGFFGGEPLLQFGLIREITELIEFHPAWDPGRVTLTVVTNGTIFSREIVDFLQEHDVGLCISCDGPPYVQDRHRRLPNGRGSAHVVERTIRQALNALPIVLVNAVYGPDTLRELPSTVEYLSSLGVRQIYLNPDFTAHWTRSDADALPLVHGAIGRLYVEFYLRGDPHLISSIDSKIAVILRGGYHPLERCRMGRGEFAFTPGGGIFPCERLVGEDRDAHRIGTVEEGIWLERLLCHQAPGGETDPECRACGLRDYCMNWCGCSNYFSSGYSNRVSAFLCASERATIAVAFETFRTLESTGVFFDHLAGAPAVNSLRR